MLHHKLQPPPQGTPIPTPPASSAMFGAGDVVVGTPPDAPIIPALSAASARRALQGRGSLIHPWQQTQHPSGSSHAHDSGATCSPPPAPVRPMPGVVLVPAEEALLFDDEGGCSSSDDEAFGEQYYSGAGLAGGE
jgi:hypothetical protein